MYIIFQQVIRGIHRAVQWGANLILHALFRMFYFMSSWSTSNKMSLSHLNGQGSWALGIQNVHTGSPFAHEC